MEKRKIIAVILLALICSNLVLGLIQLDQFKPKIKSKKENKQEKDRQEFNNFVDRLRTSSLQYSGLTIVSGMNLNDGQPYYFYGEFYDSANYESSFSSAYLESKLIGDDDRTLNDSMYLSGSYQDASFNSTSFTNGSIEQTGNLNSQDGSETWFESSQVYRYPGTYSFDGEVGLTGTDVSFVSYASTTSKTRVSEIVDKHRDILNQTNSGSNDYCYHNFEYDVKNGVVEFWVRTLSSTKETDLYLQGSGIVIELYITGGYFKYKDSSGVAQNIQACSSNTWYHIRVVWRDDSKFDVWIGGVKKIGNVQTRNPLGSGINIFYFQVYDTTSFLDAWGQSWSSSYILGTSYYWQYYTGVETVEGIDQSVNNGYYYGAPHNFNLEFNEETDPEWVSDSDNCTTIIKSSLSNHLKYLNITGGGSYRNVENVPLNTTWNFLNGTKVSDGHLLTINNQYSTLRSQTSVTSSSFSVNPNGDNTTEWHTSGTPHYAQINDYPDTSVISDFIKADTTDDGQTEQFDLETSTISSNITSLILYFTYMRFTTGVSNDFKADFYDGVKWLGLKTISTTTNDDTVLYGSETWTGLQINQLRLDALQVKLIAPATITSNAFYIYSFKVAMNGDADSSCLNVSNTIQFSKQNNETIDYVKLYYSHKTNESATVNFYAYNFITSSWTLINSSDNSVVFANNYYSLSSSYYNSTYYVKIRYISTTSTDGFLLYIDRLSIISTYALGNETTYCYVKSNYAYSSSDTIEFWWATNSTNRFIQFGVGNSTNWIIKVMNNESSYFYYHDGISWIKTTFSYSVNIWYHIKISWTNSLITDRFSMWINGYCYVNNKLCFSNISSVQFFKLNLYLCQVYLDAFGIVSDSAYLEGQNKNPYEEDLVDTDFSDDWTQTYNLNTYVLVQGEFGVHRNIVTIHDNNATSYASARYSFSSKSSGKVEFWFKSPNIAGKNASVHVGYGSSMYQVYLIFDTNMKIKYYDGSWTEICNYWANTWYHIRIDFDCGTDKYSFYLNQTLKVSNVNFLIPVDYLSSVQFRTCYLASNYNVSVSTISFDWEYPMYTIYVPNVMVELNFTCSFVFTSFDVGLLHLKIWRYQYTTVSIGITFYIYNWSSSSWLNVSKTQNTSGQTFIYMTNTSIYSLISSNTVLFRFYGAKYYDDEYTLKVDRLQVRIYQKTTAYLTKTYYERGVWKYRFHLISSTFVSSYTDWVYFDVVESEPNVELISESDFVTKWNFINSIGTPITIYENSSSDFNNWIYEGMPDVWSYAEISYYVGSQSNYPVSIFWDGINWWLVGSRVVYKYDSNWVYTGVSYVLCDSSEDPSDIFWDGTNWWMLGSHQDIVYKYDSNWVYTGVSYYVGLQACDTYGLFWDGTNWWIVGYKPDLTIKKVFKYDSNWVYTGVSYSITQGIAPYKIFWDGTNWWMLEAPLDRVFKYDSNWVYTGVYYSIGVQDSQTTDIFWDENNWWVAGQTNDRVYKYNYWITITTNVSLNIIENTEIQITFNSTVTNSINFNLLNDGIILGTYEILKNGNGNFLTQQVIISIDSDLGTIDQLQIESSEWTAYRFYLEYLEIIEYNASIESFYVNPHGLNEVFVPYPYDYEVQIYENNILKEVLNLTSSQTIQTLIYERTTTIDCYINFYDINNDYLNFFEFKTYVNYTFEELPYTNVRLTDNIITADSNTFICFLIYDSFDTFIKDYTITSYFFIDITLNIYSLKIKNNAEKEVSYQLQNSLSNVSKLGILSPGELKEYSISSGNYSLNYTNHEDCIVRILSFQLITNKMININTTYQQIYFALFTYDGLGVDPSAIRFYINSTRKDLGFNTVTSRYVNLTVKDFFDYTMFQQTIDTTDLMAYNIYVEIYTLNLLNLFNFQDIKVNVSRGSYWMEQVIPTMSSLVYRFIPNINYTIIAKYLNDTIIGIRTLNLTLNGHIESFGETTPYPTNPFFPAEMWICLYNAFGFSITDRLRIYKNNSRVEGGRMMIETNSTNIVVRDYFDRTLYNRTVQYSRELNVLINTTTVIIHNERIKAIVVKIKLEGESNWRITQALGAQDGIIFEFINGRYVIMAETMEGLLIDIRTIDVGDDEKIVSFGFYEETEIPETPDFKVDNVWLDVVIILVILGLIIATLLIYLFRNRISFKIHGQNLTKNDKNSEFKKNKKNKKRDDKYYEKKLYNY